MKRIPNNLTYPMKVMQITQNYKGEYSHKICSTGTPADYPIDDCGNDAGRDWLYCPCDAMVVKRIYGIGGNGTNTMWLTSTGRVDFADKSSDYLTLLVMHSEDDDLKNIKTGQVFKRGEKICREGMDGNATGNHLHISAGKGTMLDNGWVQNSLGGWVLTTTNGTVTPESVFFVDEAFTKVKFSGGLPFRVLPRISAGKHASGDVNGDGKIDIQDIVLARAEIIGNLDLPDKQAMAADIDGNGIIDISDVARMRKKSIEQNPLI